VTTFQLTADRVDLAREFRRNPYGVHGPELQAALDQLRLVNPNGKMILVCTRPNQEWVVAELRGSPLVAHRRDDLVFGSLQDAEWSVFKLRWKLLTGGVLHDD
jgi:hypothetical protein